MLVLVLVSAWLLSSVVCAQVFGRARGQHAR